MPIIAVCHAEIPHHVLNLNLTVTAAGSPPAYSIAADPGDPHKNDVTSPQGDLEFTGYAEAIGVIIQMKNTSGVPLSFDNTSPHLVFLFGRDYSSHT